MNKETVYSPTIHHRHNIKRLREILGVKQEALERLLKVEKEKNELLEKMLAERK